MIYIYVLFSPTANLHYVGMTDDLQRRLSEHNKGKSTFTSAHKPWNIIYFETAENYAAARKREKYLKTAAGKKFVANKIKNGITGSQPA